MKFTAIYVRRSVSDADKGNNSLSINAQKEECIRHLGEDKNYKIYCDDGKSGKDIEHRPAFMQMMQDARDGLISQIIVKKYDRFSRNMREYLNVSEELDNCGVPVISLCEPFCRLYGPKYFIEVVRQKFHEVLIPDNRADRQQSED